MNELYNPMVDKGFSGHIEGKCAASIFADRTLDERCASFRPDHPDCGSVQKKVCAHDLAVAILIVNDGEGSLGGLACIENQCMSIRNDRENSRINEMCGRYKHDRAGNGGGYFQTKKGPFALLRRQKCIQLPVDLSLFNH